MVSHHSAKSGDHRRCDSGDINIPANTVGLPQIQDVSSVTVNARLLPPLLVSLKHVACHALAQTKFQIK